jgi:hypothetical protein
MSPRRPHDRNDWLFTFCMLGLVALEMIALGIIIQDHRYFVQTHQEIHP